MGYGFEDEREETERGGFWSFGDGQGFEGNKESEILRLLNGFYIINGFNRLTR